MPGPWPGTTLGTPGGQVSSDRYLHLTDDFPPAGLVEFDLEGRQSLRFTLPPGQPAWQVTVRIGFRNEARVEVTALSGNVPVVRTMVSGGSGDLVTARLEFDIITGLELGTGPAALIELCFVPVAQDATKGWETVPDFPYPLSLPVFHPDYPCTGGLPVDPIAAEHSALGRVRYGPTAVWAGRAFAELHDQLIELVDGGPTATPMAQRSFAEVGVAAPPAPGVPSPHLPSRHPLDLVLLGALHPAIAQMVGLYWADQTAAAGVAYDYLILPDRTGRLGGDPYSALAWLEESDFLDVDGFIVFNRRMEPAPPLEAPRDVRVYALPGGVLRTQAGGIQDASNNAGLRWDRGVVEVGAQVLLPGRPILYHLWRADLGDAECAGPVLPGDYRLLTERQPILLAEPRLPPGKTPERPPDWPPFPLHTIDTGLKDGWYSYQVSGVDIFGRHSDRSAAGAWYQWTPAPVPCPWYYQEPAADAVVHPSAVRLLDKIPPPSPSAIEAYALDPSDPLVVKDPAYQAWRAPLTAAPWYQALSPAKQKDLIGLRVRWQWPEAQARQAPDTREFRLYYQPGRLNALLGRTMSVSAISATESAVETDIPNTQSADAYVKEWLRIGADAFKILASEAGSPLRLRVKNIGTSDDVRPRVNAACTVAVPARLATDYTVAANWQDRIGVVDYNAHVTLTRAGAGERSWRQYEVFLPDPAGSLHGGLPLVPSLAEPIVYAQIGVSAADDKTLTSDAPQWAAGQWGGRYGNEGPVGSPVAVVRIRRELPPPPVPPPDSEKVFATPADYHGRSFYTYRWSPKPHLKTHVYRALDDAVFQADWMQRPRHPPLSATQIALFPAAAIDPRWTQAKRQQVIAELNQLDTFSNDTAGTAQAMAYYRSLSNDGLRVLAGLPGNEHAFSQVTLQPLDPADPITANRVGPDNPSTFNVDPTLRAYLDTLDGRSANRFFYRAAYVDGASNRGTLSLSGPPVWLPDVRLPAQPRLLKVLGGNRRVTLHWEAHQEPAMHRYLIYRRDTREDGHDIRGMGSPVADLPAAPLAAADGEVDLGAGTDAALVERVYAAAGFDPAADLLAGQAATQYLAVPVPPVGSRVPGVAAPDGTPVVIIYRDAKQGLQCTPWEDATRVWTDEGLTGGRTYYYRIVATRVGETGNGPLILPSPPSDLGAGRAVDLAPPDPPVVTSIEWIRLGEDGTVYPYAAPAPPGEVRYPAVHLAWTSVDPEASFLVQYRVGPGAGYANASGWLPAGSHEYVHRNELGFQDQEYRIKVISGAGNLNSAYAPAVLPAAPAQ